MSTRSSTSRYSRPAAALAVAALALSLAGCSSASSSAPATPGASVAGATAGSPAAKEKVRIILDWTPNTDHTGIYVARDKGFYAAAGLDVEILPFSDSGVEAVLAAGGADFGFSGSSSLTPARAAGQKIKAVEVVLHKPGLFIGYSAKRTDITRPKDLDGKTYAGFGLPWEKAVVTQVIKADGGTANFKSVSLSTSAYEAVYSGAADFAQPLVTWEGIEAELNGTPLSYIDPRKYGVPADYTLVISGNESFLSAKPAVTKAFVQATQKGYAWAADHPAESADLLIAANPQVLKNPELVKRSQDLLSKEWFRAADGRVGFSDPAVWQGYSDWLFKNGLLTDADGNPAKEAPKAADLYTNEFLAP